METVWQMLRKRFQASDDLRDAGLTTPADICRYDDICYGTDRAWQVLDVYRPKGAEGKLPVIVSIHGGGWVYGDKERYQFYCMDLAQRGFAVVNFTYRLAPQFQFPSSIEDTNLVFSWVLANAERYGFDLENLFAVGDSAGAHMLGIYAAACTNPAYAATFPFRLPEGFCPKAVGLHCGAMVIAPKDDPRDMTAGIMAQLLPGGGTQEEFAHISPVNHITPQFPPVFFMTSTGDFLQAGALRLAQVLVEKQVPFQFHFYGDKDNRLGHVFHLDIRNPEGRICNDEVCAFFRKYIQD